MASPTFLSSTPIGIADRANIAAREGRRLDSEWILRDGLLKYPGNPLLLVRVAELLGSSGKLHEAASFWKRAIAAAPLDLGVRLGASTSLRNLGEYEAALAVLESAPAFQKEHPSSLNLLSSLLSDLTRSEERLALLDEWIKREPKAAGLHKDRADVLVALGQTDEAIRALRRSIQLSPSFGEAWWTLSNIKSVRFDDRDRREMTKALRGKPRREDKVRLHFALGKAYEDVNNPKSAFRHYDEANRTHAEALGPLLADFPEFVEKMKRLSSDEAGKFFAGGGNPSSSPIFIVGMHRAGSTLVEQILSSHSLVEATKELSIIHQLLNQIAHEPGGAGDPFMALERGGPALMSRLGSEYLKRTIPFRSRDTRYFIDKQPANWSCVPLIRLMLPNAKIVDARRHPMACGFSNFRQFYPVGIHYSFSQQAIGEYYRLYLDLMDSMEGSHPTAVHRIINENLIDDPEEEIRRMLMALDLPFDPACLEFHRSSRPVHTPSAEQVRRPINRDGVDSWRPFAQFLEPMRHAMGDALQRWNRSGLTH